MRLRECADVVAAIAVSGAQFAAGSVGEAADHLRVELAAVSAELQGGGALGIGLGLVAQGFERGDAVFQGGSSRSAMPASIAS